MPGRTAQIVVAAPRLRTKTGCSVVDAQCRRFLRPLRSFPFVELGSLLRVGLLCCPDRSALRPRSTTPMASTQNSQKSRIQFRYHASSPIAQMLRARGNPHEFSTRTAVKGRVLHSWRLFMRNVGSTRSWFEIHPKSEECRWPRPAFARGPTTSGRTRFHLLWRGDVRPVAIARTGAGDGGLGAESLRDGIIPEDGFGRPGALPSCGPGDPASARDTVACHHAIREARQRAEFVACRAQGTQSRGARPVQGGHALYWARASAGSGQRQGRFFTWGWLESRVGGTQGCLFAPPCRWGVRLRDDAPSPAESRATCSPPRRRVRVLAQPATGMQKVASTSLPSLGTGWRWLAGQGQRGKVRAGRGQGRRSWVVTSRCRHI